MSASDGKCNWCGTLTTKEFGLGDVLSCSDECRERLEYALAEATSTMDQLQLPEVVINRKQ